MSTASASAHAMEKDSPRFSGMLMMEGSGMLFKTWKLRFCELRGAELRYFAKEGDSKPTGSFVVTGATDVPEGENRIDIHGSAGKRRLLRVSAQTPAEKTAWLGRFGAGRASCLTSSTRACRLQRPMRSGCMANRALRQCTRTLQARRATLRGL